MTKQKDDTKGSKDREEAKKSKAGHSPGKKVFDVVRPGGAPALPRSRPVITGHQPPVQDDQFVPSAPPLRASDPSVKRDLLDGKHKKTITPASSDTHSEAAPNVAVSSVTAPVETPASAVAQSATDDKASVPDKKSTSNENESVWEMPDDTVASSEAQPAPQTGNTPANSTGDETTPAHMAMEQSVEANDNVGDASGSSSVPTQPSAPQPTTSEPQPARLKTIDDLLAETGAPVLEPESSPSMIISHHHSSHHWLTGFLVFFLIILVAAIALDLLFDAGILHTNVDVPYTDFLN